MRNHPPSPRAGFTLLELMIVVTIVGILAATAVPAFQGYLMKSRANDGRMMVEMIKLRQEAYRSEFGSYVTAAANPGAVPSTLQYEAWVADPAWTQLGFAPPGGQTRFQLTTLSGTPGAPARGDRGYNGNDFTYWIEARSDFDGDGQDLVFEGYSEADFIWCSHTKGWE